MEREKDTAELDAKEEELKSVKVRLSTLETAHNLTVTERNELQKTVEARNVKIASMKKNLAELNRKIVLVNKALADMEKKEMVWKAQSEKSALSADALKKMHNCASMVKEASQKGVMSSTVIVDAIKSIQHDASTLVNFPQNTVYISKNIIGAAEFIRSKVAEVDSRTIVLVTSFSIYDCVVSGSANPGVAGVSDRWEQSPDRNTEATVWECVVCWTEQTDPERCSEWSVCGRGWEASKRCPLMSLAVLCLLLRRVLGFE